MKWAVLIATYEGNNLEIYDFDLKKEEAEELALELSDKTNVFEIVQICPMGDRITYWMK